MRAPSLINRPGIVLLAVVTLSFSLSMSLAACSSSRPTIKRSPKGSKDSGKVKGAGPLRLPVEINNLSVPTDLTFDDRGALYFIEQTGSFKTVKGSDQEPRTIAEFKVPRISGYRETGLLGLALSPRFNRNRRVYVYHSFLENGRIYNRVVSFSIDRPGRRRVIVDKILGNRIHVGGKLQFGPDDKLYVAVGEANQPRLSQDLDSLNGKILRVTDTGGVPEDNPFAGSPVFAYGLRNVFGMAFSPDGKLFITENGPEDDDEINLIEAGENYGWPSETGPSSGRFKSPLWTFRQSISPTGIVFYNKKRLPGLKGQLVFGDYNYGRLYAFDPAQRDVAPEIVSDFDEGVTGVAVAPDGAVYVATQSSIKRIDKLN